MKLSAAVSLALVEAALAQQAIYGQCGGIGWTGATTCTSGNYCSVLNPYYSQCLPGTASSSSVATTLTTSVKSSSTTLTTSVKSSSTTTTTSVKPSSTSSVASSTTKATSTTSKASSASSTTSKASSTSSTSKASSTSSGSATTPTGVVGNPFLGKQIYANPYYASEISASVIPVVTGTLKTEASAVAQVGTFVWLDTAAKVPTMDTYLADIKAKNAAGASPPIIGAFVVYDLPDRDCAALASNGEYSIANNGLANYEAYVDSIATIIKKYPETEIALVIEPDSLANLVTNLAVPKCAGAQEAYTTGVEYALAHLNFANVAMYIDAGHSGWLGWSANLQPAVDLFAKIYKAAGSPAAVRGLATNVANYNAWSIATCPSYTGGNPICDEKRYVDAMGPLLAAAGFPAHFITDTSRNGVQPTSQLAEGDWCNVINTGFGVRPTTDTGDAYEDAFVWVKPGGEADGTSNTSSARYDAHCGYADALQGAPEAGTWFEAYFEQLLKNANPSF